jgi:hypothetical protein
MIPAIMQEMVSKIVWCDNWGMKGDFQKIGELIVKYELKLEMDEIGLQLKHGFYENDGNPNHFMIRMNPIDRLDEFLKAIRQIKLKDLKD